MRVWWWAGAGSKEITTSWPAWVEWSTQPKFLLTILSSIAVVIVVHWSIVAAPKKSQAPPPALSTTRIPVGKKEKPSAPSPPSSPPETPTRPPPKAPASVTKARGGGAKAKAEEAAADPDVWRSPRLAAKKGQKGGQA